MSKMVLTDAVVIILTSPIFTFFLGAAVLGEQINRVDLLAVHHLVAIHYFFVFGSCTSIITLLFLGVPVKVPLEVTFLFAIFGSGFFSFIGQIFMTKGFQQEKAGIASVMRYFDVVFVVAMDVSILGESVNILSLVGAAIIMAGVSMIVLRRACEKA
uniref:EamA domain-containing protein n=1 Tax=Phytophthora ramorum TaxID=164328 RepID=H3H5E2_PHYRM